MADDLVDLSETADSNTTFRGVSILGTAKGSLMDNALRSLGVMIARVIQGTKYIYDTLRIADSDDVSKVFGFDAGTIPGSTTRSLNVENAYQIIERGASPRLVTAYTASGTHTFNTATKYFQIVAVGGGGGSGGVDGQGGGTGAATAGGNSGFYGRTAYLAKGVMTTGTVVIGAAGAAGASTAGDGGDGGDTTWTDATTGTLTWKGGKGSSGRTATGTYPYVLPVANSASSGALAGSYGPGGAGLSNGNTNAGGIGGGTPWGAGGIPSALANSSAVDGVAGSGYGAGASGAASNGITTNAPGAAGTGGRLEVWEF